MNIDLERLGKFLAEAYTPAKFEPSIFSIGGRGYYENPTSDLLAFFWQPEGPHGLKTLFLDAFLECIPGSKLPVLDMDGLSIQREVPTTNGARIDLLVIGRNWCLVAENKVRHVQNNPFAEYRGFAERLHRDTKIFVVLSPDGTVNPPIQSGAAGEWRGVSYAEYCKVLRSKMGCWGNTQALSKWQVFAKEFVEHLQQECCKTTMDQHQVDFVEKYQDQIASIKELERQYRSHVVSTIAGQLNDVLKNAEFRIRDEGWAFRCTSPIWGEPDMVLFQEGEASHRFLVRVYVPKKPEDRHQRVAEKLSAGAYKMDSEGRYTRWTSIQGFGTSAEAIGELATLAKTVNAALVD